MEGVYAEDRQHEDVMVLLEAVRPKNIQTFLEHEFEVAPAEKVHVRILYGLNRARLKGRFGEIFTLNTEFFRYGIFPLIWNLGITKT